MTPTPIWVVEGELFPSRAEVLRRACERAGHGYMEWEQRWREDGLWPSLDGECVIFYGSLSTAAWVRDNLPWRPGALLDEETFTCSNWFPAASAWLVHRDWQVWTAAELAASPEGCTRFLGDPSEVFLRADSPLKPFPGQLIEVKDISLERLGFGLSFQRASTPVVVAARRDIGREWRFVVADREVVAGCLYADAAGMTRRVEPDDEPWKYAAEIARRIDISQCAYALDVCEADGELRLLELNPFSGADLFLIDLDEVVRRVGEAAQRRVHSSAGSSSMTPR